LRPKQGILALRKELKLYTNLRPAVLYDELVSSSPLKPEKVRGLDILIVRELNGDIYFGQPRGTRKVPDGEFAGEREGFDTIATASRRLSGSRTSRSRRRASVAKGLQRRQGQRAGDVAALARPDETGRRRISRCRALAPLHR
jgi:3-isopropylmalate dehydrogenase